MLIILWVLWSVIWAIGYSRETYKLNLEDLHNWDAAVEYSNKFLDFKLGSIFNLFLIAIVIVVKHFFGTFGFILQSLFLLYSLTGILVFFKRLRAYSSYRPGRSYNTEKIYNRSIRPYLLANILYILYTFYLYGLSHYILSIW